MENNRTNTSKRQNTVGRSLFGVHIILKDGDEDPTVRPTRLDMARIKPAPTDCPGSATNSSEKLVDENGT